MLNLLAIKRLNPTQPTLDPCEHGYILRGVQELEMELGKEHWYGLGAMAHQRLPLEKISIPEGQMCTGERATWGATTPGLLGTLHPFWFNSRGVGIEVLGDSFRFAFNPPIVTTGATGVLPECSDGQNVEPILRLAGDDLSIRIFVCSDAPAVVRAFWDTLEDPGLPPENLLAKPLWSTWAHFKSDISQEKILAYAREIASHRFPCSVLGIDSRWQQAFGDCKFDPVRFPSPAALIRELHDLDLAVSLWTVPFINQNSELYAAAADIGMQTVSGEPYLGQWWEGDAAFVDLTNTHSMSWFLDNLERFAKEYQLDGFKFDAGEAGFYCDPQIDLKGASPNLASTLYIESLSKRFPWCDVRTGWRTQGSKALVRQWDKNSVWSFNNGLASCITQAITLSLLGYQFNFPDMIGGNEYGNDRVDAEMMIRWTQAVSPMPIMQHSIPPWRFGEECAAICLSYAHLHQELVPLFLRLASQRQPIIRPLWWLAPHDEVALCCEDEYLIGDNLLVAPVINQGARSRDIYFPPGAWRAYRGEPGSPILKGSTWVQDYHADLHELPIFTRV